jgi:broad specificity phosphatase PhoE
MNIFFIRHAESLKSVQNRHGGRGLPVTKQGEFDIAEIIFFLENEENVRFDKALLFCSDRIQVVETAKIIESLKQISFQIENAIRNISLGVLDGLSDEEALLKYPSEAINLAKWRKGLINIDDFTIPNAETMEEFYRRIFLFISSLVRQEKDVVLIGTRSVGVAIANIFNNFNSEIEINNYRRYKFDPASISKFLYIENTPKLEYINRTDFLSVKPKYPDE